MVYIHNWEDFLQPYELTVSELKLKLEGIRAQFNKKNIHSPIESVRVRVKTINSILDKADRMGLLLDEIGEKMHDIAGVRITCQFVEDIYSVVALLKNRKDIEVIYERDYVSYPKLSGYRSYHIHATYDLETTEGTKKVLFEVQIRTMAMNVWATVEHSLNYKYEDEIPQEIKEKLIQAAEAAQTLDNLLSQIKNEISEAQQQFIQKKQGTYKLYDDDDKTS
ncbi:MAG: pyrophosphokinae [Haloplasmataceae bacterium]|jgi:putative GTP pyrophosphokinase|nr:pyrophosphokinae [Haloplasmataceae bacterium]